VFLLGVCDHEEASAAGLIIDAADDGDGRVMLKRIIARACEQAGDAGSFTGDLDFDSYLMGLPPGDELADKLLDMKCREQIVDRRVFRK